MQLILVRHAEAVDLGQEGTRTDAERHLTPHGRDQAARLADACAARGVVPTVIVSSPLVRARQTAEPLLRLLGTGAMQPQFSDYLAAGALRRRKLSQVVNDLNADVVLLVGHNPDVGVYAGWLIGAGDGAVTFEKAAAAAFRFDGGVEKGTGTLEWLLPPLWFMNGSALMTEAQSTDA